MMVTPLRLAPGPGRMMTWAAALVPAPISQTMSPAATQRCFPVILSAPDRTVMVIGEAPPSTSLPRGREGTDLIVGAEATRVARGLGVEAAGADAGGRLLHRGDRDVHVARGRLVTPHHVGLDEAKLDALGQATGHLAPGERVQLELEIVRHAAVGVLLALHLAGLVVDDHGAQQILVDAVEAAAHAVGADREGELLLDVTRLQALGLLVVPEARERRAASGLPGLLVLPGQEALVLPLAVVLGQQVLERRVVALDATLEIELDDRVDGAAVDDRVMPADRYAQDVDVAVLERTRLVVVHLFVAQQELLVGRQRRRRLAGRLGRGREALDLLHGARLERPGGVLGEVQR